nr:LysR family transcriptional regulator [Nocardia beijingensis]
MDEFTVAGLRVVREAAACGSFSTAAENLGYTQSAVSRQIALMERAAGRALFERHARGVQPTEAGRIVLRHADVILGELDQARHDIRHLATRPAGRLRIGAFSTAMAALVPRAIAATTARDPRLRISLREGLSARLLTAVARERLDLAVVTAPDTLPSGVVIEPLLDDPLLVAVGSAHPLAGAVSATPDMLRDERWIAGSQEPSATLSVPGATLAGSRASLSSRATGSPKSGSSPPDRAAQWSPASPYPYSRRPSRCSESTTRRRYGGRSSRIAIAGPRSRVVRSSRRCAIRRRTWPPRCASVFARARDRSGSCGRVWTPVPQLPVSAETDTAAAREWK